MQEPHTFRKSSQVDVLKTTLCTVSIIQ